MYLGCKFVKDLRDLASGCADRITWAQVILGDMGVDLGGGDIGMTQQGLDAAQVRAALHQMGGEGMAQHMRTELGGVDTGASAPAPFSI